MKPWICDGQAKDGKSYPNTSGAHEPYENYGPDCAVCGLPQESLNPPSSQQRWLIPAAIGVVLVAALGIMAWLLLKPEPNSTAPQITDGASPTTSTENSTKEAVNPEIVNLISSGERILLDNNSLKASGAQAFQQNNWNEAIAKYQEAVNENQNDPESKIYLNNAQAKLQGNTIAIAAVVPIGSDVNASKEILRGIAQYQSEYNQNNNSKPLKVIIANQNAGNPGLASSLAQALVDRNEVLAIIGYGADGGSRIAMQTYESSQLAVVSPINTQVDGNNLKLISINQSQDKLVEDYLDSVAKTLLEYSQSQKGTPKVAIFHNSNSDYSNNLKQSILNVLPQVNGQVISEIDVTKNSENLETAINNANQNGANTIVVALSKDRVPTAIQIAEINQQLGNPLIIVGSDEMYNPDILVQGQDKINGIVLAVPWSSQPGDTFAQEALKLWKGKVSWRTKTAYDATNIIVSVISNNPNRLDTYQSLQQGIQVNGDTVNFSIFNEVPLVKATPGNHGPQGSTHGFSAL